MSHVAHELTEEFPDKAAQIHALKLSDAHFARLVDDYHEVNRAVHRAEGRIDTLDDSAESALRHKRMQLKDEIFRKLSAA
jgi:uncharacterized protein